MQKNIWIYIIFITIIISIIWCLISENKNATKENINIENKIEKNYNYDYDGDLNKYYIYKSDGTIKDIINPEEFESYEYDPNLDFLNETE